MNEADRKKRDRRIEQFFNDGTAPTDIAKRVGLNVERVRTILRGMGHNLGAHIMREDSYFWALSESRRREAIWRKQRDGARQALGAVFPSINNSHRDRNETGVA